MASTPCAAEDDLAITVLSGLHAGATSRTAQPTLRLGRGPEADIRLADPGIRPLHAAIHREPGGTRLEALEGEVTVEHRGGAAPGTSIVLELPATIGLEGTRLEIVDLRPRQAPSRSAKPRRGAAAPLRYAPLAAAAVLFCTALAYVSFARVNPMADVPGIASAPAPPPPARAEPAKPEIAIEPAPADSVERARADLEAALREAGLADLVTVSTQPGSIVAQGSVPPALEERWRAVQTAFDADHGERVMLVADIRFAEADAPPFALDAVWSGANPNVIVDGQKYLLGAVLEGGWTLEAIRPDAVTLRRGERSVVIRY